MLKRLGGVVLDDQQLLAPRLAEVPDAGHRALQALGARRLGDEREGAAGQTVLAVLLQGDDLHGDVARGGALLELTEHRPAEHVGQEYVERDGGRVIVVGESQGVGSSGGGEHLEAVVMRQIDEHPGIVGIVLDDQQNHVPGLQVLAIVGDLLDGPVRHAMVGHRLPGEPEAYWRSARIGATMRPAYFSGRYRVNVLPLPGMAAQLDLAAEQVGKLAADRQAEAGAAVLAAGAGIGLLEGLEDDPLLLGRDADAGVRHLECDDRGRLREARMIRAPSAPGDSDAELDAAVLGELEGVGQQVLQHLLEALGVGDDAAVEMGVELDVERQVAPLGLVTERSGDTDSTRLVK